MMVSDWTDVIHTSIGVMYFNRDPSWRPWEHRVRLLLY